MTFDATVNPVVYEGGVPVFIDTEYDTWNIVKHPRVYKNEQDICQKDFPFIVKPTSAGGKRGIKVWS